METDVLVVGAGPVGLMMAGELRRHAVRCRVIDKLAEPAHYCKDMGIQPRTLEIWEQLGIATEMINGGIWLRGMWAFVNGLEIKRIEMDLTGLPYGFLGLPQYDTERILTRYWMRQSDPRPYYEALQQLSHQWDLAADGITLLRKGT
jgi:2-polyprenyl-6-methoxyphenol hydroxylase-like FAD-dependent oxidoreductase